MDQVHVIRHKVLVEGVPIRKVAKEMAVSRNTAVFEIPLSRDGSLSVQIDAAGLGRLLAGRARESKRGAKN